MDRDELNCLCPFLMRKPAWGNQLLTQHTGRAGGKTRPCSIVYFAWKMLSSAIFVDVVNQLLRFFPSEAGISD